MTLEEMRKVIYRYDEEAWHDYNNNQDDEYLEGRYDGIHEAAKIISCTTESELKPSGKWNKTIHGNGWDEWYDIQCSNCAANFEKVTRLFKYKYCPNCGAKMEEK